MSDSRANDQSARLTDLERRLALLRVENQRLRNLLKVSDGVEPPPDQPTLAPSDPGLVTNSSPPAAKLALYQRLFAARPDVYAKYWENPRKRTKGWYPVTRDPFRKGSLWDRRPLPLTAEVVADHLHKDTELFIGLYPLLADATCWWLAADFDGPQAMLDAHAYVKAAASLGVPCGLEISQSGRGAHAWTFFTAPVSAADARAMGTACLHRAMALRGSMPLTSYDRLFPNQDTVPVGASGVGSLIAAPLNGKRRIERRTTVFVDLATWEPWPDQWEYLSRLDRMTPRQVASVARKDRISVGPEVIRLEASPATAIQPRPPAHVRGTLAARLTILDKDLTPGLSAALRHAATIHNPGFYEAQRARRSTWQIPRFIQGFDVAVNGDLILPRGLLEQATALIAQSGGELTCEDERGQGNELAVSFLGRLDDRQTAAVDALLAHEDGILHAPTGSGKTVMACAVIAERAVSTLILINKTALAAQWRAQLRDLLGIKAGQLGGGRTKLRGQVDIMLLQTLARHDSAKVRELTKDYGQVIVDECHHLAAGSFEGVVSQIGAAWWLGLTATPERKDGLEQVTSWQLGPIRHVMKDTLPSESSLVTPYEGPRRELRIRETAYRCPVDLDPALPGAMTQLDGLLAVDVGRNQQIAADVAIALEQGRKCLVLSRRRDHLTTLAELLPDTEALIMRGGIGAKALAAIRGRIADTDPGDPLLVMTTVPYGGEGFDAPIIDTVFLVGPISFPGLLTQAVGRALRRHEGKTEVIVHDYVDADVPVLKAQFSRRRTAYRQMGFTATFS
ncbi:putative helicase [Microlunatus phosphovorus NM-1]|uniref:Putative helicase n=1 Tax=Microlunatus phosphovorus (strain ATCC 700054 / DSM 10555 / JCM 9379 / NBRC 101784 / NCIMB 13414 / VKM Ac-1990 / NM-1) TaxID=1032480 RepID=F5XH55_MICPN|nr:DEAD/DEAH box helicase [Microlunatus phosphovorus]BAK38063.1 putative helicase [Microlunatus phosphovorus NM-1]